MWLFYAFLKYAVKTNITFWIFFYFKVLQEGRVASKTDSNANVVFKHRNRRTLNPNYTGVPSPLSKAEN